MEAEDIEYQKNIAMATAVGLGGRSMGISLMGSDLPPEAIERIDSSSRVKRFDLFVSYTSQDRASCVLPLVDELTGRGIRSWLDVHEIVLGDSIVEKIQTGLSQSALVLAFVSEAYLAKPWPLKELRVSLVNHITNQGVVLPILLGVDSSRVHDAFPFLSDVHHMSIREYDPEKPVSIEQIKRIADAIQEVRDRRVGVRTYSGKLEGVPPLNDPIELVRYDSDYSALWISSRKQALDSLYVPRRVPDAIHQVIPCSEAVDLEDLLLNVFSVHSVDDVAHVAAMDMVGHLFAMVLESGNCVWGGCGYVRTSQLGRLSYITTGVSPSPSRAKLTPGLDLVMGYRNGQVQVVGFQDGRVRDLKPHDHPIAAIDTSRQSTLFTVDSFGEVRVWSLEDLKLSSTIVCGPSPVSSLSIKDSADDRVFALGHSDGTVSVWTVDGRCISRIVAGSDAVRSLAFLSAFGNLIAAACGTTLSLLNYSSGTLSDRLSVESAITALHVSSFGRSSGDDHLVVASGHADGRVATWDVWRTSQAEGPTARSR